MGQMVTVGPEQVRASVSMADAIDAVRLAFIGLAAGEFEMPIRTPLGGGDWLIMSVRHQPTSSAMVKTLSLNFTGRQPAIVGTVVWSELARTGQLIADASAVTTLRTGAATGVATDLLAPREASRCTIIGAGGQALDQVRAVHAVRPLTALAIVARDHRRGAALAAAARAELDSTNVAVSTDPEAALGAAEIVCCATTSLEPLFRLEALPARVHVNAIGSFRPTMRELPDELLGGATLVVDDVDAVLEESGEVIHALDAGLIDRDHLVELGRALTGQGPRTARTAFKSVGVAVQDWAIARLLAERFLP
jgi:ornithine cyclodeaminase/alanine dehydrogenase-like protein (mu-crystallin family)